MILFHSQREASTNLRPPQAHVGLHMLPTEGTGCPCCLLLSWMKAEQKSWDALQVCHPELWQVPTAHMGPRFAPPHHGAVPKRINTPIWIRIAPLWNHASTDQLWRRMVAANPKPGEGYQRGAAACQRYQIAPGAFLPPSCLLTSLLMPSADALCCARAPDHDRGCFGTHRKGWRLPGHWQEGDELARGSSPALWELGSLLTFTRDDFTFGCSTQNQDTTTCKAKLCMSPSQTYKICPAKMCPSITWQSRRGLSKLCASRDELIPLGNHAPHGTRGFLRSFATQAIAGFSDPVAPSGTGRSDGEGLRGTRDTASREGAVPASLRGAGGRGQWRNPIWQSL